MEARHSMPAHAVEVVQRRGTYTIMTDTVVPPECFAEFLESTHGLIGAAGIDYLAFGHFGDCHLHFTLLPEKEQLERATQIYDEVVATSAALGGVYSGEHGTGKRKRQDFVRCYGASAVEEVRRAKAAVDPHFILNRGTVVEPP
jgi:D-lactate dehydrogenase (cytochrome)